MPSFGFRLLWIFPWIKFPCLSCSMWDKPGWLYWFWQLLWEMLSSFNPRDINVHQKNWLTYSGGNGRSGQISNDFTQIVNFPTQISDCDSHSPALLDLLFLLTLVYVLQWLSLHWEILICCCLSFHWLSIIFTARFPLSLNCLWLFSCWLGQSLWSFEICCMGWCL